MARSANRNGEDGDSGDSERGEMRELSLVEVLKCYEQPINEEQAWAVCYQCCRELKPPRPNTVVQFLIPDLSAIILHRDGTITAHLKRTDDSDANPVSVSENKLVQSIGVAIYHALDWGLDDSEERELSPQLENLIEFMVGNKDSSEAKHCASNSAKDEGYSGHEEEDEEEEEGMVHGIHTVHQVMMLCASRLANSVLAPEHYQAVCRALFLETLELQTFLSKIQDAKEVSGASHPWGIKHPHFSRSVSVFAAAASSPLPLKHDTGFECDRLMIGSC
ncbi:carbohydrate sulfotransferase 6 isoform X2 [Triplophysa rosa]|uniref:carbohydrate sulfotransferase 6 isoform X2 n=1 Tax=Triplophysa rosa TaxID=992332 RepID=UPI0025460FE9|nr:carbohydrate sulfotransferase 6 isoform X2 [Triplophysa rosa]